MMLRVAVADPLPLFRHGVRDVLAGTGFAVEMPEDLLAWASVDEPRLALFTVSTSADWALLPELCRARSGTTIIAVLTDAGVATYVRAFSAGAAGVLSRDAPAPVVREVFDAAVRGNSIVPTEVLQALADGSANALDAPEPGRPSAAERDWLRQLARGDTVASLAAGVGYSERMMFRLLRDLYVKVGVSNRTEALMKARDEGWL